MDAPVITPWRLEFARRAARTREQQRLFEESERQRERDKDKGAERDRVEQELIDLVTTAVLASPKEVAALRVKLDDYHAATIDALHENGRQLDLVRTRIEEMLAQAYVLPDGRRVFRMDDGIRVVDEFGEFVDPSIISPHEIPNWMPSGDDYLASRETEETLTNERNELLHFQRQLDEAGIALDDPDLTADELADIAAGIEDVRPDVLRRHMGEPERAADEDAAPDPDADQAAGPPAADAPDWLAGIKPLQPF